MPSARTASRARARILVAASLALLAAGCSLQPPGAAAVVEDRVIGTDELESARRDIAVLSGDATAVLPSQQVLTYLVLAPYVLEQAEARGVGVSEADAVAALQGVDDPSESAITAVRTALAAQRLGSELDPQEAQEAYDEVASELEGVDVQVNPRFGTFSAEDFGITPEAPAWLSGSGGAGSAAEAPQP